MSHCVDEDDHEDTEARTALYCLPTRVILRGDSRMRISTAAWDETNPTSSEIP